VAMRRIVVGSAFCMLALSGCQAWENSTGGVGSRPARPEASWYSFPWMAKAPYAPSFRVLDTESSLGPYATQPKTITLEDLIKMHGHPCDGLVTAACALSVGLQALYPDGVIDRTDTGCITNTSPCYGDVAAYLTGGRIRFGTQKIDPSLKNEFILHRFSTGATVKVTLKPGVFPAEALAPEQQLRAGAFTRDEMRSCQQMEWDYARRLLQKPLAESFEVETLPSFSWKPDFYAHVGSRGDIINKNVERSGARKQ
jgi:formylmethanofuran dehydrogenase subunit E